MNNKTVYLDNAATTFPKPKKVIDASVLCMKRYCANPGRSAHSLSLASSKVLFDCRELISNHIGLSTPENVVFTLNTTYALNIALFSLIGHGEHVITSVFEHNSVLRPLEALKQRRQISVSYVNTLCSEQELLENIKRAVNRRTRTVVLSHASNIIPHSVPTDKIGAFCKKYGFLFILDCAQSAGRYELNMERDGITALCLPSHKGLYGLQGAGAVCFCKETKPESLSPFVFGGNGIESKNVQMPSFLPERLEAGTMPVPTIASLCQGIEFVNSVGVNNIREKECELSAELIYELSRCDSIELYSTTPGECVLFNVKGHDSESVCQVLDSHGICLRAGLHCAPLAHKHLGTDVLGGAIRASYGYFNTQKDTYALLNALKKESFI